MKRGTDEWRDRYGVPTDLPKAYSDLEHELVAADVADWRGGPLPHPSDIALVVARFLSDQSTGERTQALLALVRWVADVCSDDCRYDHDDNCQAHFLDERPCPAERAKAIVSETR